MSGAEAAGGMTQAALQELVLELHRVGAVKFGACEYLGRRVWNVSCRALFAFSSHLHASR